MHFITSLFTHIGFIIFILCCTVLAPNTALAEVAPPPTYIINGQLMTDDIHQTGDDYKKIEFYDTWHNKYIDYANGYSVCYPNNMIVDSSLSAIRTVLTDDTKRIEIYYDNFYGSVTTSKEYIEYSNQFTNNTTNHTVQNEEWFTLNGHKVHLLTWARNKLARLPNDKNYYACAEIIKNDVEVYTIFIKSSQPIEGVMDTLRSINLFERQGTALNFKRHARSLTSMNAETQAFYNAYFSPESPLSWGIFEPAAPEFMEKLISLEDKLNYTFPFLIRYQSMDEYLPMRGLLNAYDKKTHVELTLQTVHSEDTANALRSSEAAKSNASITYDILDGKYDDYFNTYAKQLKAFGHPVVFRLNNEMNGDWCWYSAYYTGKDTELYKALWLYIHTIFEANGVDNVVWVWNPHDVSRPDFKWNHYLLYYPDDEYVDIIGLTGYNNGTYFPGEKWRTFNEIYPALYNEYDILFSKPFMISEFASNSIGGNKTAWIHDMFTQILKLPKIKAAIWWSGIDYDAKGWPGRIYLLDDDEQTTKAFHDRLQEFKRPSTSK